MIFNYQIHISNVQLTAVCVEKDVPVTTVSTDSTGTTGTSEI